MYDSSFTPEELLEKALSVLEKDDRHLLSAPIYVADADGAITYFNPACINFAGRSPVVGQDRWCFCRMTAAPWQKRFCCNVRCVG